MKLLLPTVLALMLAASSVSAGEAALQLDVKTQTRLQIRLAPLQPAHSTDATSAFATVLDPAPLLTLLSDLATAQSAWNASQAEADRTQGLAQDASVAAKTAEAAQAQARADQARVTLLQQRVSLEWGSYFAKLTGDALRQMGSDLAAGRAALVRIDTPSGKGLRGARFAVLDMGALGSVNARVLGVARTADARLQSPGLITLVTGPDAAYLSTGLPLKAALYSGGGTDGLLIPNAALLRQGGQVYAYIRTGPQTFTRRLVTPARVTPDGLIVNQGFAAGESVVVQGASALFTAQSSTPADD